MTLAEVKTKLRVEVKHWKEREQDYSQSGDEKMEGYAEGKWRAFKRALTLLSKLEGVPSGEERR